MKLYMQFDQMDCGPTCLQMISKHYGKNFSLERLRELSYLTRDGVSIQGISYAAETIGMRTMGAKLSWEELTKKAPLPCIVHWEGNHFIVVYKATFKKVWIADPAKGKQVYNQSEFCEKWTEEGTNKGISLLLEPTPKFYQQEESEKRNWGFLLGYLKPYKRLFIQILVALLFGSLVSLITPFLTQAVVDIGINGKNIEFIYLILIAQIMFTLGSTFVSYIQSWISLHIGTRISIAFVSDFLIKIMKLPISFFQTKSIGDILQRMGDNSRVQSFITGAFFTIVISSLNFIIFSFVMTYYSLQLLALFMIGNILYILWVLAFMKKRREFDNLGFKINSENKDITLELFNGIEEIKLHNIEREKRWEWERVQVKSYQLSIKTLIWGQFQSSGSLLINSIKNILISFLTAKAVIDGNMTLGMMMSVQYILGQLQGPISAFIGLAHAYQDAKISIERLGEVHNREDEESVEHKLSSLPPNADICLQNISFQYEGPDSPLVLNKVNLTIPHKKTTAIVGSSGCGKTTLLKLLLKFYNPTQGTMKIGNVNFENLRNDIWRKHCGAVMQNSFIFSDTIIKNIIPNNHQQPDIQRLNHAVSVANIQDWIESLPAGYKTKIGTEGHGLSQGQRQRLLIARAVYKDPDFLFFDEATNSLDSKNERIITENLQDYYKDKTVIIVAHRLSTVRHANQIVVLDAGKIVEIGSHSELISSKGHYYKLVKNQLDI